jgi:hypothetical protein
VGDPGGLIGRRQVCEAEACYAGIGECGAVRAGTDAAATWDGDESFYSTGAGLAAGLDVTGDGILDLVIGNAYAEGDDDKSGSVSILPGL